MRDVRDGYSLVKKENPILANFSSSENIFRIFFSKSSCLYSHLNFYLLEKIENI